MRIRIRQSGNMWIRIRPDGKHGSEKSELESDPLANTDPDPKFKGKCGIRSVTDPHKDYQCGSGFYKIRIRQGLNIHLRIFKQSVDNCRKKIRYIRFQIVIFRIRLAL